MTYFAQNQASTPIAFDGASVCECGEEDNRHEEIRKEDDKNGREGEEG